MELGEEEDFRDEAIALVNAISGISSVTPIQKNLWFTSTPSQPLSSESSNKTLRGKTSQEEMEGNVGKSQK